MLNYFFKLIPCLEITSTIGKHPPNLNNDPLIFVLSRDPIKIVLQNIQYILHMVQPEEPEGLL